MRDCEHGRQARTCEVCEMQRLIERQAAAITAVLEEVDGDGIEKPFCVDSYLPDHLIEMLRPFRARGKA